MAIDQESFNTDLYKLLRTRGYKPVPKDAKNQRTQPEAAEVFNFTFTKDGKDYGDAWVTIDDASNVVLYYSNEQEESPSGKSPNLDYDDSWSGLKRHLKQWSMNKQLSFELRNKDELGDDMAQRDYVKKKEKMNEGYHSMGRKASYNDNIPAVKIILQHNRQIEEGEQRYRNIAKIFLENQAGERFLAPTIRPGIAQVYARHIAEGGVPNDERWNHVKALCEEYSKMAGFVRATKNKQFMESAQQLVSEGINHYQSLRETLGKLRGHRGYNMYFESWTPALMEDDTDSTINELFVQETVDPRIESVMPILARLNKNKTTTTVKEVEELAEWADSITEMDDGIPDNLSPSERKEREQRDKKEYEKNLKDTPDAIKKKLQLPPHDKISEEYDIEALQKMFGPETAHDAASHKPAVMNRKDKAGKSHSLVKLPNGNYRSSDVDEGEETLPEGDMIGRTLLNRGAYKAALKVLTGVLAKKMSIKKHSIEYYAADIAQSYPGVDAKELAAMYKKQNLTNATLEEDLDADQKRVGQLGPTEKVGKAGAVGKLVGANESVEINEDSQDSVANALYNRVTRVRTDLITKYGIGAINDAIDEVSSQFAGEELDEIGSSDVSGWIRQLEQILASSSSMSEGYRPGEINNGDQVQIKKDSPYYEPGTWTVSQCTDDGKCWIGDEDDRGWYIRTSELELTDSMGFGDDDDFDPDFVYGKSEDNDFGDFGDDPRDETNESEVDEGAIEFLKKGFQSGANMIGQTVDGAEQFTGAVGFVFRNQGILNFMNDNQIPLAVLSTLIVATSAYGIYDLFKKGKAAVMNKYNEVKGKVDPNKVKEVEKQMKDAVNKINESKKIKKEGQEDLDLIKRLIK